MNLARSKALQAGLVILITIAIILAGAFAWYSFTQQAVNIFEGFTNPNVNLHDDFDGTNKDVYVENNGQRPLYVRVRFDEYMDIDGNLITTAGNKNDPETWPAHKYIGTNDAHFCNEECHKYYTWTMGNAAEDTDNGWKYFLPSPFSHRALFDRDGYQLLEPLVNAYDHSLHTADSANVVRYGLSDGFDPANDSDVESPEEAYIRIEGILDGDFSGSAITSLDVTGFTGTGGPAGQGSNREYLDWLYAELDKAAAENKPAIQAEIDGFLLDKELGYWDITYKLKELADTEYYTPSNRPGDKLLATAVTFEKATHLEAPEYKWMPINRTLETATVYTMSQWIAAGMPIGDFWVMDSDGWCYWANVVLPTQTTGLLMSEVLLNELNPPAGVWYYGINVTLQAVTAEDIGRFALTTPDDNTVGGGIEETGQMVLDSVSSKYVFGVAESDVDRTTSPHSVKADATFHTYQKFGDNTYRLVTPSGNSYAYGPLFIYTGATSASADAMRGIYDKYTPEGTSTVNGTDNSEYKIGTEFWKKISAIKWAKFKVVDAEQGTAMNNNGEYSGVFEAKNGKRYVKLEYYDGANPNATAWLAVGENGVFDSYVANNSKTPKIVPDGFSAGTTDNVSDNDDILVWTEKAEPGIADRYVEEAPENVAKIGDVLRNPDGTQIDGHDWLVIGMDTNNAQSNLDKTLIIAQDVSAAVGADGVQSVLTGYSSSLSTLVALGGGGNTPILLTVQEAMDYFANNAARAASLDNGTAAKWWVAADTAGNDGDPAPTSAIDTNGAFGADTGENVGIRVAIWVDTTALNNLIYPAS